MEDTAQPSKPLLVYDGDCGFCRRFVRRWLYITRGRVNCAPYQRVAEDFPQIPRENFERSVQLIEPDGQLHQGAHAIFRSLALGAKKRWLLWLYRFVPGVAPVTEGTYRFVASHRKGLSALTPWLVGPDRPADSYLLTRWLFVRLMGIIYLIAFASLGVQVLGLVGTNGILPAQDYLDFLRERLGDDARWRVPTLAWLTCTDQALQWACWAGVGGSALVILRVWPGPILLALWVLYLSLYHVGQTFLSFQWDILLLEAGFLTIFFASWKPWPRLRTDAPPSRVMRLLIWWLLFRLMFCSGVVKLLDENPANPTWAQLTALTYHYETTCIPNLLCWYAHQLPLWFHKLSIVGMFIIEIKIPFLIFLPRLFRLAAFFALALFQVLIILTGNYNFFNLLTLVLCVALLDDKALGRFFPHRLRRAAAPHRLRAGVPFTRRGVTVAVALVIVPLSAVTLARTFHKSRDLPRWVQTAAMYAARVQSVNNYGLFRSMTTRRPEIIVEGSNDRRNWQAYEFRWKPGDLNRRPPQVAPHQPRLDWQMWFAALGRVNQTRNQWFVKFVRRLLEGSPEVLALLENNPFPHEPPRYIRAVLYDYHYTDRETKRETGAWWKRTRLGLYMRPVSLRDFRGR